MRFHCRARWRTQRRVALVLAAVVLAGTAPAFTASAAEAEHAPDRGVRLRAAASPLAGPAEVAKALDFSARNDAAVVEGTVSRGAPHRYLIKAKKGQSLSASLQSKDGARFDLYEPGASLTQLPDGYVVQGMRVGNQPDGTRLESTLLRDGEYLLLLRPEADRAFYTLELAVRDGGWFAGGTWWREKNVWLAASFLAGGLLVVRLFRRKRNRRIFGPD